MPCFICAKCLCIDNTATGHWWGHERANFSPSDIAPTFVGKPLCCECAPTEYKDGSPTDYGRWHDKFPKEHYSVVVARADKEELKSILNLKDFI